MHLFQKTWRCTRMRISSTGHLLSSLSLAMHTRRSHYYFCLLSLFLAFERALLSYHTSRCSQPYGTSTQNTSRSPSWYFWNYDFLLSDGLSSSPFPAISYGHLQPIVCPSNEVLVVFKTDAHNAAKSSMKMTWGSASATQVLMRAKSFFRVSKSGARRCVWRASNRYRLACPGRLYVPRHAIRSPAPSDM